MKTKEEENFALRSELVSAQQEKESSRQMLQKAQEQEQLYLAEIERLRTERDDAHWQTEAQQGIRPI